MRHNYSFEKKSMYIFQNDFSWEGGSLTVMENHIGPAVSEFLWYRDTDTQSDGHPVTVT